MRQKNHFDIDARAKLGAIIDRSKFDPCKAFQVCLAIEKITLDLTTYWSVREMRCYLGAPVTNTTSPNSFQVSNQSQSD